MDRNLKNLAKSGGLIVLTGLLILNYQGCSNVAFTPTAPVTSTGQNTGSSVTPAPVTPIDNDTDIVTESFMQKTNKPKVDILFVDDNSGSMTNLQQKLGQRISSFLGYLQNTDWQIGITTTDVSNDAWGLKGSLLPFAGTNTMILTPQVSNYEDAFLHTIVRQETASCDFNLGNCPSGNEQPLRAAILAMQKHNADDAGFFRPDAHLVIVMLSDEDEMSNAPSNATTADEVLSTFQSIWGGTGKTLDVYGLIIVPNDMACFTKRQPNGQFGTRVADLVSRTRGILGSICESDYGPTLATIGQQVSQLVNTVELAQEPSDSKAVIVTFQPQSPNTHWHIDHNTLVFDNPPPQGTKITVKYPVKKQKSDKGQHKLVALTAER